jgi:hypothetical protein
MAAQRSVFSGSELRARDLVEENAKWLDYEVQ